MAKITTKRRCKLGQECGMSCINKNVVCHKKPPEELQPAIDKVAKKIKERKPKTETTYVIPSDEKIAQMKVLGQGAYGKVVLDEKNNVAIKIAANEEGKLISKKEIDIATEAGKLGVGPKILANIERDGSSIIAMEYLEGKPISKMDKLEKLSPEQTRQLIDNVRTLHTNGIAHNDLHGGNVFLQNDGKLKIVDYGLADKDYRRVLNEVINLEKLFGGHVINKHGDLNTKYKFTGAINDNYRKYSDTYWNIKSTDTELKSAVENFYKDIYSDLF